MAKRAQRTTTTKARSSIFQLRISLCYIEPAIWRRLLVPANIRLGDLHFVLNEVMGWTCSHLHSFTVDARTFGDPRFNPEAALDFEDERAVALENLIGERQSLRYDYDFGDGWEHEVSIKKRLALDKRLSYPLCIAGARACPPEDCGGPPGYDRLLAAPSDPEHDSITTWVGGHFDPEGFDVNRTNQALRALKTRGGARRRGA